MNEHAEKILDEIKAVNLNDLNDGSSFADFFVKNRRLTAIEQALFYMPGKKLYYNYSEKRLRFIIIDLDKLIKNAVERENNVLFVCHDVMDEWEDLSILFKDFSNKKICYTDKHKVITHDDKTGHYECFYIDENDVVIDQFFANIKRHLPERLRPSVGEIEENSPEKKKMSKKKNKKEKLPEVDKPDIEEENVKKPKSKSRTKSKMTRGEWKTFLDEEGVPIVIGTNEDDDDDEDEEESDDDTDEDVTNNIKEIFETACQIVAHHLLYEDDQISKITFVRDGDKVRIQVTASHVYMDDDEDDEDDDGVEIVEDEDE